jgi:hypothetical protein
VLCDHFLPYDYDQEQIVCRVALCDSNITKLACEHVIYARIRTQISCHLLPNVYMLYMHVYRLSAATAVPTATPTTPAGTAAL